MAAFFVGLEKALAAQRVVKERVLAFEQKRATKVRGEHDMVGVRARWRDGARGGGEAAQLRGDCSV
jgi:hypothetical protein